MASETSRTALMLDEFVTRLRRRKYDGSLDNAKRTAVLMRQVIADSSKLPPQELLVAVRTAGKRLMEACRTELSTGNLVRRVLHIIREETAAVEVSGDDVAGESQPGDEPAGARQPRGPSLATLLEVHEAPHTGASPKGRRVVSAHTLAAAQLRAPAAWAALCSARPSNYDHPLTSAGPPLSFS